MMFDTPGNQETQTLAKQGSFCCESSFLEISPISSCLRELRAWEKRGEGVRRRERERHRERKSAGMVPPLAREIVSEKSYNGRYRFNLKAKHFLVRWGEGWLGCVWGGEDRGEL